MARVIATRLTSADVIYVLQSSEDNSTLAERFNVTRQAISSIRNNRTWKDIAPEIPRIPVRLKNTVSKASLAAAKHCHNCIEYQGGECSYGFPEAIDEPEFAAACSLYKRNPNHPSTMP